MDDTDTKEGASVAPVGYSVIVPKEWERIPLRTGAEEAVQRILDESFGQFTGQVPREKLLPFRKEAERRLLHSVAQARTADGLELYIPVNTTGTTKLAASFVISAHRSPSTTPNDPHLVAAELTSRDQRDGETNSKVTTGEIDNALAVRREWVVEAQSHRDAELGSRRVVYYLAIPNTPGRWLGVSFSALGTGDPHDEMANALVEWFDALMDTFVWTYA